jgi:hypothetical protein
MPHDQATTSGRGDDTFIVRESKDVTTYRKK